MRCLRTKLKDNPYAGTLQDSEKLVEIFDDHGRPIMITPLASAIRHKFPRRMIFACLRDNSKRVFLTKSRRHYKSNASLWGISAFGDVLAGESVEGACLRRLQEYLGITAPRIQETASLPFVYAEGVRVNATFFLAGPVQAPGINREFLDDGMFVEEKELKGLLLHQADMFSPLLVWAMRSGWIFPNSVF